MAESAGVAVNTGAVSTGTAPANRQKLAIGRKGKKSNVTDLGIPVITRKKKRS